MKYLRHFIFIFCCYLYSFNTYATAGYINTYNTDHDQSNYTTNYTSVRTVESSAPTTSTGDDSSDQALSNSTSGGGLFTVNPFSPNPLKPNFGKCFSSTWSVTNTSTSTAFVPQITAHNSTVVFCIGYKGSVTLHGYGQCNSIGIIRVCARITESCTHANDRCCSDTSSQNTSNKHGDNSCGAPDPNSKTCPNCVAKSAYRVCAFEDPASPFDLTDSNYSSMSFHWQSVVPPAVTGGSSVMAAGAMVMAAGLLVPGLGIGAMMVGEAMVIAGGIMELVQLITSKMNYNVVANRGCVDLPLTPFPPPYCSPIQGFIPQAEVSQICQYSPAYAISPSVLATLTSQQQAYMNYKQVSTYDNACEITGTSATSPVYSTFENPIVRISFSNPIPACPAGYTAPPSTTTGNDTCVIANNIDTPYNIWINQLDQIPACSSTVTTNCITFPSGRTYGGPFRPLYTINNLPSIDVTGGSTTSDNSYYVEFPTIPSLASSAQTTLTFNGINDSGFIDATPGSVVNITDFTGSSRVFVVNFNSTGDQICVTERANTADTSPVPDSQDMPVSCIPRPMMMSPPTVSQCNGFPNCYYSMSSTPSTQPRIQVSVGNTNISPYTGTVASAQTGIIGIDLAVVTDTSGSSSSTCNGSYPAFNPPTPFCVLDDLLPLGDGTSAANPSPCSIYASGSFSAYITDMYNQTPDASGNGTITPTYSPGAVGGVQYVAGMYCRGASQICLSGYSDPTKTVIAKVIPQTTYTTDSNGVTTTTTTYNTSNKVSDRIIPPYTSGQTTISTFYDSNTNGWNTSAAAQRIAIGGTASQDGSGKNIYYENLSCTSDPNNSCTANGTPVSGGAAPANGAVSTTCTCTGSGSCLSDVSVCTNAKGTVSYSPSGCNPNANPSTCTCATCSVPLTTTCTMSGCEWAFVTTNTNASIQIGDIDSITNEYYENPACNTTTSQVCSIPSTNSDNSTPVVFPIRTICQCLNTSTNQMESCSVPGCNWAFQPPNNNSITSYNGYYDPSSNTYYCLYGGNPGTCTGTNPANCGCYNAAAVNNQVAYAARPANSMELGLCTSLTQESCPATNHSTINDAQNDGYANWPNTPVSSGYIQGTCVNGTIPTLVNGVRTPPTRACIYNDTGYSQVTLPCTTSQQDSNGCCPIGNGCPTYTIGFNSISNPCIIDVPLWWPSAFLAGASYQGAIFNMFGPSASYYYGTTTFQGFIPTVTPAKFVPTYYNSPQYDGTQVETWMANSSVYSNSQNACRNTATSNYVLSRVPRTYTDGDQEMLFLTLVQWGNLWKNHDLTWLLATPNNLPNGASYDSYNGCYVYDVTNNISATLNGITVGMKICKYGSKISFSLVDTHANNSTSYTNNAYIMQSNLLHYYGANTNRTLSGDLPINHGIVVDSANFPINYDYNITTAGPLPSNFVSISTPETYDSAYSFQSQVYTENTTTNWDGSHNHYPHCEINNTSLSMPQGCALSAFRSSVNYPYSSSSPVSVALSTQGESANEPYPSSVNSYIPLTNSQNGTTNLSIYLDTKTGSASYKSQNCWLSMTINGYTPGNSAANPSMFLWNSSTSYNVCNGSPLQTPTASSSTYEYGNGESCPG